MKQIILTKGLPASGKSTWARETILASPGVYKRVNKDELRAMLDASHWSKDNEKFIQEVRDALIVSSLKAGKHVIVDDTNLAPKHEARIRQLASEYQKSTGEQVAVVIREFDADVETCIKRDLKRTSSVGEKVIRGMYKQFIEQKETPVHDPALPYAVLCDLDGTLCLLNGRNPYDASTCEQDTPNPVVESILLSHLERHPQDLLIFLSGRTDEHRPQTLAFLDSKLPHLRWNALYMRQTGDNRKDSIIKEELYRAHVQGRYNVRFVLDDRNQVVELWRRLGLTCLQVADGDF